MNAKYKLTLNYLDVFLVPIFHLDVFLVSILHLCEEIWIYRFKIVCVGLPVSMSYEELMQNLTKKFISTAQIEVYEFRNKICTMQII